MWVIKPLRAGSHGSLPYNMSDSRVFTQPSLGVDGIHNE